ncbi:uncharacterized protein BDZ99DRAFT_397848, partial [Mytilinidion resinicola]
GYHPRLYKKSITIVLYKPQKALYIIVKAYRPIALLKTIGKILEKIVAIQLFILAKVKEILPLS